MESGLGVVTNRYRYVIGSLSLLLSIFLLITGMSEATESPADVQNPNIFPAKPSQSHLIYEDPILSCIVPL